MKPQHLLCLLSLALGLLFLWNWEQGELFPSVAPLRILAQDQDPTPAENSAPSVGKLTHLYEGWRETGTLNTQSFSYITLPFLNPKATHAFADGVTTLDTTADQSESAGYFSTSSKGLDRAAGYGVRFSVQVEQESHIRADRAGFSVLVLSSQDVSGTLGIELGFWTDEIWAQEGGEPPELFTHAEGVSFDTTVMHDYDLMVLDGQYALYADGALILSGALRDYSAFQGQPNPYTTPDLIFLGDDTGSAATIAKIAAVSYITNASPAGRTLLSGARLSINDLGVLDLDAVSGDLTLSLQIPRGNLTLSDAAPGGVAASALQGNGTGSVTLTGNLTQLNNTLAYQRLDAAGVLYQDNGTMGDETVALSVLVNDNGHSGGAAQSGQKQISLAITSGAATATPAPRPTPIPVSTAPAHHAIYLPVLQR